MVALVCGVHSFALKVPLVLKLQDNKFNAFSKKRKEYITCLKMSYTVATNKSTTTKFIPFYILRISHSGDRMLIKIFPVYCLINVIIGQGNMPLAFSQSLQLEIEIL